MTEAPDKSERAELCVRLKLLKMISVLFSFRLSIDVGSAVKVLKCLKFSFSFRS